MDSSDRLSIPRKTIDHKLGKIFLMSSRRNKQKPGRELVVTFDKRFPLVENFDVRYSYFVRFLKKGNTAGNHYHCKKHELMIPLEGNFEITLEDIKSKKRKKFEVSSGENLIIYVYPKISHAVKSLKNKGLLFVLATSANNDQDEFPYQVTFRGRPKKNY